MQKGLAKTLANPLQERKRQDSNLRTALGRSTVFEAASFSHSDTLPVQPPRPPFQGGDQGLRAFHRRNGFPCPPTPARHLMMPASPSDVRAKELRGFLLPYTPGASRNCLMLRGLTDFRVVKITTLKSSKSLIISVLWVAPLRSAVLPSLKSGGSTLESCYPTLQSCYSTSEGPSATVSVLPHL